MAADSQDSEAMSRARDALVARRARLLERVAAEFDRDMALAMSLAAKYPDLIFVVPGNHDASAPAISYPQPSAGLRFDGSVEGLIDCYKSDPNSGYRDLRFRTRENYDSVLRRIKAEIGPVKIADLASRDAMHSWHQKWSANGHLAMANSIVAVLKMLSSYGGGALNNSDCLALKGLLSHLRFARPKARTEGLTGDYAARICDKAHEMGLPSIALAQAIQFETGLKQKSVIGEWVPISEPGTGPTDGPMKWLHGLRWSEIDSNLVLRHARSDTGKIVEAHLADAPMVMTELSRLGTERPTSGPVIVHEITGKPYLTHTFRREWRKIARAAGVPDDVKNRDSRVGAYEHAAKENGSAR